MLGCFGKEKETEEVVKTNEEKIITIAEKAEIKTLDPQNTVDSASLSVIQMINQRLFKIDNNGNIIPEIAEEATKVNEKTTLIKIKKDLFFSNGEPVTVDDVLFSLNRAKESPRMTQDFYMIESFEKVDDSTIKVKTFYEAGNLLHKLASMGASIMSKKALEENETNIVGSGMFKLKEWVAGDRLVLERNTYFKDANSNIKEIVIKFIPEANSRMIMLETGEVDIAESLLPLDFQKISKEDDKFVSVEMQSSSNMFIGFDLRDKHLADKRVRQAIAYAINNQDIVDSIYNGSATVATSPIPKITTGHNENSNPYTQNIEKAKQLLAEAGYKDTNGDGIREDKNGKPFEIKMAFMAGGDVAEPLAQNYIQSWKKIGIKAVLTSGRLLAFQNFYEKVEGDSKDIDVFFGAWGVGTTLDPTSSAGRKSQLNYSRFVSEENDRLMAEILGEKSLTVPNYKAEAFKNWQKYYIGQAVEVPLMYRYKLTPVNKRLKNVYIGYDAALKDEGIYKWELTAINPMR